MPCDLCQTQTPTERLDRFSGLDLCARCRVEDPAAALLDHGIHVDWGVRMGWFSAETAPLVHDRELVLRCVPELLPHKVMKLVVHEVEVGDPTFDAAIYVRTNHPDRARSILTHEGIQSALLGLLSGVRSNELGRNQVELAEGRLRLRVRPLEGLSDDKTQALKLETAALALQLARHQPRHADTPGS